MTNNYKKINDITIGEKIEFAGRRYAVKAITPDDLSQVWLTLDTFSLLTPETKMNFSRTDIVNVVS